MYINDSIAIVQAGFYAIHTQTKYKIHIYILWIKVQSQLQ